MMYQNPQEELEALKKRIIWLSIVDAPGSLLVGFALMGKYAGSAAFHPLLNNSNVTTVMLTAGAVIMGWVAIQILTISQRRKELERSVSS